jgi:8-oxo-dGTP pyrophosphatase MutT (NUDIX family)
MAEADAAVAIVHAVSPADSVLLMRRAERESDPWSGHWSFPGGRREPEDADALETALRELQEECGIRLGRERLEKALTPMLARRRTGPFLLVAPFVFRVDCEFPATPDEHEAVEARWVPLSVFRDPARHRVQCAPGMPAELAYPCVPLPGPPLWGFTYRLMMEWLGLCPPATAGRQAAAQLLDFLIAQGLPLVEGWAEERPARWEASVGGTIPVGAVMERFAAPGCVPPLNVLETRPDLVRLVGLDFEEYRIRVKPR